MEPFARTIDAAKKYVVSSTLDRVDWNAEFVRGDLGKAVQQLKRESGNGLFVGGVKLPQALAELGLIDEYEFVVHSRLVGHGPTLCAGLSKHVDLKLVSRLEFGSGRWRCGMCQESSCAEPEHHGPSIGHEDGHHDHPEPTAPQIAESIHSPAERAPVEAPPAATDPSHENGGDHHDAE
jgi:hypothetical protein